MNYMVAKCTNVLELVKKAREAGFEVWAPVERVRMLRTPHNKPAYYEVVNRAAVYGYVYIPEKDQHTFLRWAPSMFRVAYELVHIAPAFSTRLVHINATRRATVHVNELKAHAREVARVNEAIKKKSPTPVVEELVEVTVSESEFMVGELVEFVAPTLETKLKGTIDSFRGGRRARIIANNMSFTVPLDILTKI